MKSDYVTKRKNGVCGAGFPQEGAFSRNMTAFMYTVHKLFLKFSWGYL